MPNSADVIVLGLGGMGSAALYALAQRGVATIGFEQFEPVHAHGSSHGQTRLIRRAYFEHPDYVPLLKRSYELWAELEKETGSRLYHETGLIYFCDPEGPLQAGVLASSREHGIDVRILSDAEIREYGDRFRAPPESPMALYEPQAGYLEVENCVAAHIARACRLGAIVRPRERVLSWKADGGSVKVVTDRDEYSAGKLVIAAGAWSARVFGELRLPLYLLRKTMYWFPAGEAHRESSRAPCFFFEAQGGAFYGFPDAGSGLKAAEHTGGQPMAEPEQLESAGRESPDRIRSFVRECLPGVGPEPLRSRACMYTMTPDRHFIIDLHPEHRNVAFAAGFSGHGFKFSSIVGEILAELAIAGRTRHPARFLGTGRLQAETASGLNR